MLGRQSGALGQYLLVRALGIRREGTTGGLPEQLGFDTSAMLVVPGHDGVIPDGGNGNGGARGCALHRKTSMTTMRPPQQGQGGRGAGS